MIRHLSDEGIQPEAYALRQSIFRGLIAGVLKNRFDKTPRFAECAHRP
jgi:hypothetical protein